MRPLTTAVAIAPTRAWCPVTGLEKLGSGLFDAGVALLHAGSVRDWKRLTIRAAAAQRRCERADGLPTFRR